MYDIQIIYDIYPDRDVTVQCFDIYVYIYRASRGDGSASLKVKTKNKEVTGGLPGRWWEFGAVREPSSRSTLEPKEGHEGP